MIIFPDPCKGMDSFQRFYIAIVESVLYLLGLLAFVGLCALFTDCSTPRAVEEHHHHHYEADTAAVHAQVDARLTSWHAEMKVFFRERMEQFVSQQQQTEHQQETITETVTVSLDSMGREIRQEQRTISRDISRELQSVEQHITREYEQRLMVAIDSLDAVYRQRYDSLQAHVARLDSSMVKKTPVAQDNRPWYQRLWYNIRAFLIVLVIALVVWFTRNIWWPFWKKLLSHNFS